MRKITIVGEAGIGKTKFVSNFLRYPPIIAPTLGVEVHPVDFGNTRVNFWDCGGTKPFVGLGPKIYGQNSDMFIVIYKDLEKARVWFEENIGETNIPCKFVSINDNPDKVMSEILETFV